MSDALFRGVWPEKECSLCHGLPSVAKSYEDGQIFYLCASCIRFLSGLKSKKKEDLEATDPTGIKAG